MYPLRWLTLPGLCLCAGTLSAETLPAVPFRIVDPPEQQTPSVTAGSTLAVTVSVGPESGTRRVSYFWYRQEEEPVSPQWAQAALVADAEASPPFGGPVPVPRDVVGPMRLLAVAEVAQGRMGTLSEFDERVVTVEPGVPVESLEFTAEKPWLLVSAGKLALVPAVGVFRDGVVRSLAGAVAGLVIRSDHDDVVRPQAGGWVQAMGPGQATLTVGYGGRQAVLDVTVAPSDAAEANGIPRADPGAPQHVRSGMRVVLSGVRSMDPDGDPLHYEWTQVRGMKVDLVGPNESVASFVAPKVSLPRLFRFRLTVADLLGPDTVKGGESLPAYVDIWVDP